MNRRDGRKQRISPDNPMVNASDGERIPLLETSNQTTRQGVVRMFVATFVSALGPVCFGYALGFASPATADLSQELSTSPRAALSPGAISWFGSLINVGAILGGPLGGRCAEKFGRKTSIMLAGLPFIVGWVLVVVPSSFNSHDQLVESMVIYPLCLGRTVSSIGLGMLSVTVPVYIAETSTAAYRGFLGTANQVAVTQGILFAYVLGIFVEPYYWLAIGGMVFVVALVVLMLFVPETPRWLLMDGQQKAAKNSLQWLRGDDADISNEFSDIERNLMQQQETFSWSEFLEPTLWKPFVICIMLLVFQQLSGINSVMFFASVITNATHPSHTLKVYEPTMIGGVQVTVTILAGFLMDRLGRRVLLITSTSLMTISCVGIGVFFKINVDKIADFQSPSQSWLAISCLILYVGGFSLGLGAIPWLIMSEVLPTRARGTAGGIAAGLCWMCSFLITFFFHDFTVAMEYYGTFWFYGGVTLLTALFVIIFVPETKGKTLEEIETYFER